MLAIPRDLSCPAHAEYRPRTLPRWVRYSTCANTRRSRTGATIESRRHKVVSQGTRSRPYRFAFTTDTRASIDQMAIARRASPETPLPRHRTLFDGILPIRSLFDNLIEDRANRLKQPGSLRRRNVGVLFSRINFRNVPA